MILPAVSTFDTFIKPCFGLIGRSILNLPLIGHVMKTFITNFLNNGSCVYNISYLNWFFSFRLGCVYNLIHNLILISAGFALKYRGLWGKY